MKKILVFLFASIITFAFPAMAMGLTLDYLIVAGGGAGGSASVGSSTGDSAGGGGGGGLIWETEQSLATSTPYTVTVGLGGGNNSEFNGLTALGGGQGGGDNQNGGSGGSGGGAGWNSGGSGRSGGAATQPGSADGGFGNNGGNNSGSAAGGGGGAETAGSTSGGGNGKDMSAELGTEVGQNGYFAGGGGGGNNANNGLGTGANTGGGGFGKFTASFGPGDAGVVIIRYETGTIEVIQGGDEKIIFGIYTMQVYNTSGTFEFIEAVPDDFSPLFFGGGF